MRGASSSAARASPLRRSPPPATPPRRALATTFADITLFTTPSNHSPVGTLDCNGSGCHTTGNVNAGGFKLGSASLTAPTLSVAGHTTVAAAVAACQTCHESAPYVGMMASSATAWGDSRPQAFDKVHPATGDCNGCHTTTPTFVTDMTPSAKPANHIPTSAPCTQCHTTAGNYAAYSVTGTHQGVTGCLSCHGSTVATTFANITLVTNPSNHFPLGTLDCNGSGCHTTGNVNAGGFKLGTASIASPTLSAAGHTTATGAGLACATCHETAPYLGMIPSTSTVAGDSRPQPTLASNPPTPGDCGACHVQTPTFATNLLPTAPKPANHIPTAAACAQCHMTAGNFALYSVTGVHQGISGCLSCHGSNVAGTFSIAVNPVFSIVTTPSNHFPVGSLDCNRSGCHTTGNVNTGGFKLGSASLTAPTLSVAGHTTVAAVAACQTCHESAPYVGMMASSATAWGDSRPQAFDKLHPATGDCSGCHTTTPTFATDVTPSAKPANHIPTNAPCTQCHTTVGNNALYSVTGTHQGVTGRLSRRDAHVRHEPAADRAEAGQSHSNRRRLRAVPHDGGQLRPLFSHRSPPGDHRVSELPWLEHRTFRRPAAEQYDHGRRCARQSLPRGQPRLQPLGLSQDLEREHGRLQARHREPGRSDAPGGRPYDGGGGGRRLPDLP